MLQILFNFVFKIIQFLGTILVTPIFAIASPFLNTIGIDSTSIINWFSDIFSFVPFICTLLHIPKLLIVSVFSLGATIFTFNMSLRAIGLIQALYITIKGPVK